MPPREDLCQTNQGSTPFICCSISTIIPFPKDKDGIYYLFIYMELFSKWVDTHAMPSLHSQRAIKFLYNNVVTQQVKLNYVCMDNGIKLLVCSMGIYKGLGIFYYCITIGYNKANRQVERIVRIAHNQLAVIRLN